MVNDIWKCWHEHPVWNIPIPGNGNQSLSLHGVSVAALKTNFWIPEWRLMLDAGHTSPYNASMIALTHCHSDHSGNLPWHVHGMSPPVKVLLPSQSEESITQMVVSAIGASECRTAFYGAHQTCKMEGTRDDHPVDVSQFAEFIPLNGGSFRSFTLQKQNIKVETFSCDHSVACLGYGFSLVRTRLKGEFQGRKDIAALKSGGVDVQETYDVPVFAFLGDTTHRVFDSSPTIFDYPTIIVECTFLDDSHVEAAASTRHMHWSHLKDVVTKHPRNTFVLIHFSSRYSSEFVDDLFTREGLPNVVVWNNL